jgi:hypothetical protein
MTSEISHDQLQEEHAALIGRVTIGWNSIQYRVLQIFARLSGLDFEEAKAVIYALKSDASQRDVTIALAKVVLEKRDPKTFNHMLIIFDAIGRSSGVRNAAAHTHWVVNTRDSIVQPHPQLPKHRRLADDHVKQFKHLLVEYISLTRHLNQILNDLWSLPLRGTETRQSLGALAMRQALGIPEPPQGFPPQPESSQE